MGTGLKTQIYKTIMHEMASLSKKFLYFTSLTNLVMILHPPHPPPPKKKKKKKKSNHDIFLSFFSNFKKLVSALNSTTLPYDIYKL